MYKITLFFLSGHICTHKNSQSHRSNRALSYSKGGRSLRDESRLTTDGGPELPGRGGGSQIHSHGWPPVVSDQGSGGAWSPQSLERRRGEEKRCLQKEGLTQQSFCEISHRSWFSIKTKVLRIKHPEPSSLSFLHHDISHCWRCLWNINSLRNPMSWPSGLQVLWHRCDINLMTEI